MVSSHHGVGTEQDLVVFWHVSAIYELIAHDKLNVVFLEHKVVLQQGILHSVPVLASQELLEMTLRLELRVLLKPFYLYSTVNT